MAKIINLTLEGVQVYPQTITDAIADIDSKKKLSTILKELKSEQAKKYSLVRDDENALTYHLVDGDGVACGTINIPKDTFLNSVSLTEDNELEFIFNTESGKESVKCDISKFIDTYYAGDGISLSNKKFSVKVIENKFVKVTENGVKIIEGNIAQGAPNTIELLGGTLNGSIKSDGFIACGVYAPWKDNIVIDNVTMNITNGCGVCARAGMVRLGSNVTIKTTGTALGKVGDSRVVVPCAPIVFDEAANYPAMTADSKVKVASVEHMTTQCEGGVLATLIEENDVVVTEYGASSRIVLG